MFRPFIFSYTAQQITQRGLLLIVILTLSIECGFQEPAISAVLKGEEGTLRHTPEQVNTDAYTLHKINTIIQDISNKPDLNQRNKLSMISEKFLGTPYQSNRLHGSEYIPEELIVDFRGLDCFTYLDYVVALQESHSQQDFFRNIVKTRYINSEVTFYKRKHFFTDWANREEIIAQDMTAQLSPHVLTETKQLNRKSDGKQYIAGIPVVSRNITYIPGGAIDKDLVSKLKSGDLIGVYSPLAGLDVSHVGIFIMTPYGPVLRHASSMRENQRVVDSPFIPYLSKKPGIIILRVKNDADNHNA